MSNVFCSPEGDASYPKWSYWDWVSWKSMGKGLKEYKDGWIVYNRARIGAAAQIKKIPALLLACVAHAEVGGKPDASKRPAFLMRSFDWMGSPKSNKKAVLKPPEQISFGAVSIQLRDAAHELGWNAEAMSFKNQLNLMHCLEIDAFNTNVVAKHLHSLIFYNFSDINDTQVLTDEQFIIVGARYIRGIEHSRKDIEESIKSAPGSSGREYSGYGRATIRHREEVGVLMGLIS